MWLQEKEYFAELQFLRLSSADNYNHGMKEVDVADHNRGSYRPDTIGTMHSFG